MANPTDVTIEQVVRAGENGEPSEWKDNLIYEEVLIAGEGTPRPFWIKKGTEPPAPGPTKGWWNATQKGTRYFKRADGPSTGGGSSNGGQQRMGGGRDDATGLSIERQVAFKEAAETLRGHYGDLSDDQYGQELRRLTDVGHAAIRGE